MALVVWWALPVPPVLSLRALSVCRLMAVSAQRGLTWS